ncbi:hypothetical protein LIA77_09354 [Sarocladium implicatum]|nr:hypothetical protein LIA77_09354 [Sarocladium implicatum]
MDTPARCRASRTHGRMNGERQAQPSRALAGSVEYCRMPPMLVMPLQSICYGSEFGLVRAQRA